MRGEDPRPEVEWPPNPSTREDYEAHEEQMRLLRAWVRRHPPKVVTAIVNTVFCPDPDVYELMADVEYEDDQLLEIATPTIVVESMEWASMQQFMGHRCTIRLDAKTCYIDGCWYGKHEILGLCTSSSHA